MSEVFPNLYKNVNFSVSSFDDFKKIPDNHYDIVFTMGATIDRYIRFMILLVKFQEFRANI